MHSLYDQRRADILWAQWLKADEQKVAACGSHCHVKLACVPPSFTRVFSCHGFLGVLQVVSWISLCMELDGGVIQHGGSFEEGLSQNTIDPPREST